MTHFLYIKMAFYTFLIKQTKSKIVPFIVRIILLKRIRLLWRHGSLINKFYQKKLPFSWQFFLANKLPEDAIAF
jgi:hypothetical protein